MVLKTLVLNSGNIVLSLYAPLIIISIIMTLNNFNFYNIFYITSVYEPVDFYLKLLISCSCLDPTAFMDYLFLYL